MAKKIKENMVGIRQMEFSVAPLPTLTQAEKPISHTAAANNLAQELNISPQEFNQIFIMFPDPVKDGGKMIQFVTFIRNGHSFADAKKEFRLK